MAARFPEMYAPDLWTFKAMAESEQHARQYEAYKLSAAQKQIYENMRNMTQEEQAARYNHGRDLVGADPALRHDYGRDLVNVAKQPKVDRDYDWEEVWRLNHNFLSTA